MSEMQKISILLASYNGEKYIDEQLKSIFNQDYSNFEITVSDDGSEDKTRLIVSEYIKKYNNKIRLVDGPMQGLEKNFYTLLIQSVNADFYAFSDQDDVWHHDKIQRALERLNSYPKNIPLLFCSSTEYIDGSGNIIINKNSICNKFKFNNILGYNIATGNTIIFNEAARKLINNELLKLNYLGHDWLMILYVIGVGGKVLYDERPTIQYRIHENNFSGISLNIIGRINGLVNWVFFGKLKETNDQIEASVDLIFESLTNENKKIYIEFKKSRVNNLISRLYAYQKSGIRRKSFFTNWINIFAILINKY